MSSPTVGQSAPSPAWASFGPHSGVIRASFGPLGFQPEPTARPNRTAVSPRFQKRGAAGMTR